MKNKAILAFIVGITLVGSPVFAATDTDQGGGFMASMQQRFTAAAERLRSVLREREQDFRNDRIVIKKKGEESFRVMQINDESVDEALSRVTGDASVEYAEPDFAVHALGVPNDPFWSYQWNLGKAGGGINVLDAWAYATGTGVTVAIIDTGVAYETIGQFAIAPDLINTNFVPGYDFVGNDTHPNDDNGHGTHVAGTIAESTGNGVGVAGIAYGAKLMPIKVLDQAGSGSYSDVASGIRWAADHGANVINLSLGGSSPATYLEDALAYAYNKGVVIVAAAGNDGSASLSYPAAYTKYVISVGATRYDKTKAAYSNYGSGLDVVAPGGDTSVDQNGDGYGDGIIEQTFSGSPSNFGYYFFQGTSMAAPHVSGIAALVISRGKATTTTDVRKAIDGSAEDLGVSGYDTTYGYGLINAFRAVTYDASSTVSVSPAPVNKPPIANAGPDKTGILNTVFSFDGTGSTDSDGSIISYKWKFGDGFTGTGKTITHRYMRSGVFTVTLTVTDNQGASASDTATITIKKR